MGIPEMTLGWMNSSLSMNSAEAPGNWDFSSRDEKWRCCCNLQGCWGEKKGDTQVRSSTQVPLAQPHGDSVA